MGPMSRVLSGIAPSGDFTLGNYLGALRHWVTFQDDHDAFYCVVDLHALTEPIEPAVLRANTFDAALNLLAVGLDPERCTIFAQSHVPEHPRLTWLLECIATDITHCGGPGAGQAMKIVNNMVLFQNVVALAEALALIKHAGIDPELAFEVLSKGSADSFALRNHGMKAMVKGVYPEKAFSSEYALKDIRYALRLAEEAGFFLHGADNAKETMKKAIRAGYGKEYFPVLAKVIAGRKKG